MDLSESAKEIKNSFLKADPTLKEPAARILILNPNSTDSVTASFGKFIALRTDSNRFQFLFETGPPNSPEVVVDQATEDQATQACLPILEAATSGANPVQGILIACFADLPLVHLVRQSTLIPVLGVFDAAVLHCLAIGLDWGIMTTGKPWEPRLDEAVERMIGSNTQQRGKSTSGRFVGTVATGLSLAQIVEDGGTLRDEVRRVTMELTGRRGAKVIVLGSIGMSGMESVVKVIKEVGGEHVRIVDGLVFGVEALQAMIKTGS
ncbi:hypothetical protein T439DRAFT_303231 [Meredithblackwellia eburnea MCA 4105]